MKKNNNSINIESIAETIFTEIYDIATKASYCRKCKSKKLGLINTESYIYKCSDCKHSFSPRINSLYTKVRFPNDKWIALLRCMILDSSLEECVKIVGSNVSSIQRKWGLIYNGVNWKKFNLTVREKPFKNIYANYEIIVG